VRASFFGGDPLQSPKGGGGGFPRNLQGIFMRISTLPRNLHMESNQEVLHSPKAPRHYQRGLHRPLSFIQPHTHSREKWSRGEAPHCIIVEERAEWKSGGKPELSTSLCLYFGGVRALERAPEYSTVVSALISYILVIICLRDHRSSLEVRALALGL
jgi:hypothetical protein